jgi:2-polyprenyl-3-methyl-5-hydroxy-6-metoxy-1,4-benzoquinol methylase
VNIDRAVRDEYDARWRAALAPRTGDIRRELAAEAAEYLGLSLEDTLQRIDQSATAFPDEWNRMVSDPSDPKQVIRFYNESQVELFEQIAWHATDTNHHRSLVCVDLVSPLAGREFLDYGSGIGSNALIFGLAGYRVTLADVADPLRNFARWRLQRRGIHVETIDLKHETLAPSRYDVITCFDVLEHVHAPLDAVRRMRDGLRIGGAFFLYAPFGFDPERPQHVVHDDPVFGHVRALGFALQPDWERAFPTYLYAPHAYRRVARPAVANFAYYVRDAWMAGTLGDAVSAAVRLVRPRHGVRDIRSARMTV